MQGPRDLSGNFYLCQRAPGEWLNRTEYFLSVIYKINWCLTSRLKESIWHRRPRWRGFPLWRRESCCPSPPCWSGPDGWGHRWRRIHTGWPRTRERGRSSDSFSSPRSYPPRGNGGRIWISKSRDAIFFGVKTQFCTRDNISFVNFKYSKSSMYESHLQRCKRKVVLWFLQVK